MANEQEQLKMLLTLFVEMLIRKGANPKLGPKEALETEIPNEACKAEKPKQASLAKQNLISSQTNLAMLLTQVVEKLIQTKEC